MQFQARDGDLLQTIYTFDGVLARRHVQALFWPDATSARAMRARLAKLYRAGYVSWPNREQRNSQPGPKSICWLGWRGILWVATQAGIEVEPPTNESENQLRKLESRLRQAGIRWLREPRWNQLIHDLAAVDFRLAVGQELAAHPTLALECWVNESAFRATPDVVEYSFRRRDGTSERGRRGVIPDGYFIVVDEVRRRRADPQHKARLLLEMDMATHARARFSHEKLLAGAAYVHSPAYRARFGVNAGHWLVVTTGEARLQHLMEQAEAVLGPEARLFSFTTMAEATSMPPLTAPIWRRSGGSESHPLLDPASSQRVLGNR